MLNEVQHEFDLCLRVLDVFQSSSRVKSELLSLQIAGLSGEFRTSLPPFLSHLSSPILPGLQFHQSTSRWEPSFTKPQLSSSRTEPLSVTPNIKRSSGVFTVRLCLKTSSCFTVEGLLFHAYSHMDTHTHTHTHLDVCVLPPDYISHQPP